MKFILIILTLISVGSIYFTSANESDRLSTLLSPKQIYEVFLNDLKEILDESISFSSSSFSYSTDDSCLDKILQLFISLITNEPLPEGLFVFFNSN
jgi:hypothetical protein